MEALEEIMIKGVDNFKVMPELYAVPSDKVIDKLYLRTCTFSHKSKLIC